MTRARGSLARRGAAPAAPLVRALLQAALTLLLGSGCERDPFHEDERAPNRALDFEGAPDELAPAHAALAPRDVLPLAAPDDAMAALDRALVADELTRWLAPRHAEWLAARLARPEPGAPERSGAPRLRVRLPESAHEPVQLVEPSTQLTLLVRPIAAQAVPAESLAALHVYPEAAGPHTTLLLQPSERGLEDYVAFSEPPPAPELEYRVVLGTSVAGLRLVERTLEFLDASGAPRLRVARPFLLGADGAITLADLEVRDCAVDEHPLPPRGRPRLRPGASACRVRITWDAASVAFPAVLDPLWSHTASMAEPREQFASLVLPDGRVLAAGGVTGAPADTGAADDGDTNDGRADGGVPAVSLESASAELYDAATGTWSTTGSLAVARSAFTLAPLTLPDGSTRALAIGGRGDGADLASTELYDPLEGTWSPGPALPAPTSGHAAARLDDGTLLVAGGGLGRTTVQLAPGAPRWTPAGSLRAEEPGASLTPLPDGSALLIGPHVPRSQRFLPHELAWQPSGTPAIARAGHSATRLPDGKILVVGGADSQRVELYDPATRSYRFTGATSEPHTNHSATALPDGRVVIIGGASTPGAGGVEIYDPTWGTWTSGPGTASLRSGHRAEPLDDGRVLAFGGAQHGAALASADLFDATPVPIHRSEYQLPARVDPSVASRTPTELWASVTRPATLIDGQRYPVLMFLHGNHATCGTGQNPRRDYDCSYTVRGACPSGFSVVPSHRGYDYATAPLAARGFIVVSVNANRGLNCGDGDPDDTAFNLARGRLLLRHLQQLAEWDRGETPTPPSLGASLAGKLDLAELGLMGHSRGGEAARAAYELYRDPGSPWPRRIATPLTFRAIFEIAPVDGQTSRELNADGLAWAVLLPLCDGDVADLQGIKPFDCLLALLDERRDTPKSTLVAWGANHNFFNTEWQESDSPGCENHQPLFTASATGSPEQRQLALRSLLAFFSANVGARSNRALNQLFDPAIPLASGTRIDRAHTPSLRPRRGFTLEDFSAPTGTTARGLPLLARGIDLVHAPLPGHDPRTHAASIEWPASERPSLPLDEPERLLQIPLSAVPQGVDLSAYTHLEFRAGRLAADHLSLPTPLHVQLINADDTPSRSIDAADHGLRLDGPVGGPYDTHLVLQTARIPLAAFQGANRAALRAVRFTFPDPNAAHLYIANLRASLGTASLTPTTPRRPAHGPSAPVLPAATLPNFAIIPGLRPPAPPHLSTHGNTIIALRRAHPHHIDIELASADPFPARGDQLELHLGDLITSASRHPDGDLTRVIFTLPAQALLAAPAQAHLRVRYSASPSPQWDFGEVDPSLLPP